jgi:spermidine synthase
VIAPSAPPLRPLQVWVLLAAAAVSSTVSLVLELMLATQASYLLGDHTLATGIVVGTFLAAMGLGAWLSQFLACGPNPFARLLRLFLLVELLLSPLCLLAPLGLFALFGAGGPVWLGLVVLTLLVGVLGGMEVPLLTRLLETQQHLRTALARVLALDYLGALVGALLFPLVLLPWLGLLPTAGLLALVPLLSCLVICRVFPLGRRWRCLGRAAPRRQDRRQPLRRPGGGPGAEPPPAPRADPPPRRPAPVPRRQPAVLEPRRIPLPRGAGASGDGLPPAAAPRAAARCR